MEQVFSRRITSQWRRTRWNRWVGDLFDNRTPGRGVERVRAQADKRLDEGWKWSEGSRTREVPGRQERPLVNECDAGERHDSLRKPDVVRQANDQDSANLGKQVQDVDHGLNRRSRLELPMSSGGVLGRPGRRRAEE